MKTEPKNNNNDCGSEQRKQKQQQKYDESTLKMYNSSFMETMNHEITQQKCI